MVNISGGNVEKSKIREYGRARLEKVDSSCILMKGVEENSQVWMSHGDTILSLPENFEIICSTHDVKNAGYRIKGEETYAIQFHPEVHPSEFGAQILRNFVQDICHCDCSWTPKSFVETTIKDLREKLGDDEVILGLSGGVDSSVAAVLLNMAIGKNLHCIFQFFENFIISFE